ncbi:MAG: hypothetical protein U0414_36880 [Polyangiaceae bacterium]
MGSHANENRRDFLGGLVALGLSACGGRPTCDDTSALAPDDARARRDHKYLDTGPDPAKRCAGCEQFTAGPKQDACGSCKVLKGSVSPIGTCDLFTPKK